MDPNQFQMGKSKLLIKDPASVRFSFNLKPQSKEVRANWCCFSNYESDLPRFARSSKFDQHPCPLAFHISPDQKLKKSNLGQNPKITILCPQLFLLEEVRERKFDHHARVGMFFQRPTIIPTSLLTNKHHFVPCPLF